jgi:hypothetical protein
MARAHVLVAGAALASACVQTTGGQIVDFPVAAAGRADLGEGHALEFAGTDGWHVVLTKATLHVGALYLDQAAPVSGAQATPCILPGTYIAQMTTGMDVDLLSPRPQRFPALGHGTTGEAIAGQIWLTGANDVDEADDPTPILVVEGTATRNAEVRRFAGNLTIGANRQAPSSPAGASPICKQRIVTVLVDLVVSTNGGLVVRVDAEKLFTNVDFGALAKGTDAYAFADEANHDQPSTNLYSNLHAGTAAGSPFAFTWATEL